MISASSPSSRHCSPFELVNRQSSIVAHEHRNAGFWRSFPSLRGFLGRNTVSRVFAAVWACSVFICLGHAEAGITYANARHDSGGNVDPDTGLILGPNDVPYGIVSASMVVDLNSPQSVFRFHSLVDNEPGPDEGFNGTTGLSVDIKRAFAVARIDDSVTVSLLPGQQAPSYLTVEFSVHAILRLSGDLFSNSHVKTAFFIRDSHFDTVDLDARVEFGVGSGWDHFESRVIHPSYNILEIEAAGHAQIALTVAPDGRSATGQYFIAVDSDSRLIVGPYGGIAVNDYRNTAGLATVLLPDGTTPESSGMSLSFESGMRSPNIAADSTVPEPTSFLGWSVFSLLGMALARLRHRSDSPPQR